MPFEMRAQMIGAPRALKLAWLGGCSCAYVVWLTSVGAFSNVAAPYAGEKEFYLWALLAMAGFPGVLLWLVCAAFILKGLYFADVDVSSRPYLTTTIIWLGAVVVGYIQWFHIVPRLMNRRK